MSDTQSLACTKRTEIGSGANRRLRRQDKVPGIIYGPNNEPTPITLELKDLKKELEKRSFYSQIIELNLEGQALQVVLKDIQRHPAKETPLHTDFMAIDTKKSIRKLVPIRFLNEETCVGVKLKGGIISKQLAEVEVVCLPTQLPEQIDLDMSAVDVGTIIHLSDISLPEGVELYALTQGEDHNLSVVFVKPPKGEKSETSEEAGTDGNA